MERDAPFDIVNGFLRSMPRGVGLERSGSREAVGDAPCRCSRFYNLAEIIIPHRAGRRSGVVLLSASPGRCPAAWAPALCRVAALMLVVWVLRVPGVAGSSFSSVR